MADSAEKKDVQGEIYKAEGKEFKELGIPDPILQGLFAVGYVRPSKIQAEAIPLLLSEHKYNLCAQAHHGSGKTAAFGVAMLAAVDLSVFQPQALCITHSRELALQDASWLEKFGQFMAGLKVFKAVAESARAPVQAHVVVGTPGTILAKIQARELAVDRVRLLVIDEADEMLLKQGLADQTFQIKAKILGGKSQLVSSGSGRGRGSFRGRGGGGGGPMRLVEGGVETKTSVQIALFSATFPPTTQSYAEAYCPQAKKIKVEREQLALQSIKQFSVDCQDEAAKYDAMKLLFALLTVNKSIIFTQTVQTAKELNTKLTKDGYSVSLLHGGDMPAAERDRVMEAFRAGKTTVLITSNVLARGIDDPSVNIVVNYDVPVMFDPRSRQTKPDPETYIHRIGRSGRFHRQGLALSLVHDAGSKDILQSIAKLFSCTITPLPLDNLLETERLVREQLGTPTPTPTPTATK